jgi:hypothetical protein
MNRLLTIILVTFLLTSCYTETKKPNYKFMNKVKQQSLLDSSLRTTISITPKKYYLGELKVTEKLEGSFSIKNTGTIDFQIVDIKSNCDCIKTTYPNIKIIRPNDSILVKYEMNTKGIKGAFQNSIIAIGNCQYGNQTYYFEGSFY